MMSLRLLAAVLALQAAEAVAEAHADADSARRAGPLFLMQISPHYSSLASYTDGGYTVALGFGVNVPPAFQISLLVYTGREEVPGGAAKPLDGWLPLGGASLEATVFFGPRAPVRPYAAAGFGLYTLAGGKGYNGGGYHLESGAQWDFSRYFSLRAGLQAALIHYHDPTAEAAQAVGFTPFTTRLLGAALRATFYPDIVP